MSAVDCRAGALVAADWFGPTGDAAGALVAALDAMTAGTFAAVGAAAADSAVR